MRMYVPRIRSSLCGGHQGRKVNFFSNNTYVVCTNYLCAWKTLDFLSLLSLLKLDKCSVVVVRRKDSVELTWRGKATSMSQTILKVIILYGNRIKQSLQQ